MKKIMLNKKIMFILVLTALSSAQLIHSYSSTITSVNKNPDPNAAVAATAYIKVTYLAESSLFKSCLPDEFELSVPEMKSRQMPKLRYFGTHQLNQGACLIKKIEGKMWAQPAGASKWEFFPIKPFSGIVGQGNFEIIQENGEFSIIKK